MKTIDITAETFDFIDEYTLVATEYENNCIQKFTRSDVTSLEWKVDAKLEIEGASIVRCIDSNIYVLTTGGELFLISQDFSEKEMLFKKEN